MVTTVGTESRIDDLLHDLVELDFDAAAAYDAAIKRLENGSFKTTLQGFREDHLRHTRELGDCLRGMRKDVPTEGDSKQLLTEGKVVLAGLMGDKSILQAMRTNEEDTVTAYDRAVNHRDCTAEVHQILMRGQADEHRHRSWMVSTLDRM